MKSRMPFFRTFRTDLTQELTQALMHPCGTPYNCTYLEIQEEIFVQYNIPSKENITIKSEQ